VGPDRLYGLDIETDTTVDGLDPRVAPIVAVAVATSAGTSVLTGPEASILRRLEATLAALAPGVLVTWNGAGFDLPFLVDRAVRCGVPLSLRVLDDPMLGGRDAPLPGHQGAYRASWGAHRHLDGYRVYRADVGASLRLSCALKAMARFVGLVPVEVDRSDITGLPAATLEAYVASDAELARALVARRWPAVEPGVDQMPPVKFDTPCGVLEDREVRSPVAPATVGGNPI